MKILSRLPVVLVLSGALLGIDVSAAAAATGGSPLGGQITLTGTEGKDDFEVQIFRSGTFNRMTIDPAVTVAASSGACPPETDPVTGRPTHNDCTFQPSSALTLLIDLRGGDDRVVSEDSEGLFPTARVNGGLGNDQIIMAASFTTRTLNGDDGNDLLGAPGEQSNSVGANRPTAYNGGTGIDTVDLDGIRIPTGSGTQEIGANASLVNNTAVFAAFGTTFRTDTLNAIETLSGSSSGDALTGAAAADTLIGNDGNDNLNGGDGNDNLQGGNGLDSLDGGKGSDSIDGGLGIDLFPPGGGPDTFNTRDGFTETITCVKNDVIVDDLVDRVLNNTATTACSVSTAAAKHLYDTHLSGRAAKIRASGALVTKVSCPDLKPEDCEGELEAVLGKKVLGRADYKLRPGTKEKVRLPLSRANVERASGRKILLEAKEVDADGRDRFVSRPTRVSKAGPRT